MTDSRPRKRRKMSPDVLEETENCALSSTHLSILSTDLKKDTRCSQRFVLEQIDLEVGMRQRLVETVNARMSWAMQLQQSIRTGKVSQGTS